MVYLKWRPEPVAFADSPLSEGDALSWRPFLLGSNRKMKASILAVALALGLVSAPALAAVDPTISEICPACTSIVLAGNARFQATGGRDFIDFKPQSSGSALATFAGLSPSTPYFIDIVGQN